MKRAVIDNLAKIRLSYLILPVFLLLLIFVFLYSQHALNNNEYVLIQKDIFLKINSILGVYPDLMYNLTQCGDCLILLSFFAVLFIYTPKLWESLFSAVILSGLITGVFKRLFGIQRPAAAFPDEHFIVVGERLVGHNSFPSGHSITVFTILTVVLIAFMPKELKKKILWISLMVLIGIILVLTRVAVGAHHPIDVTVGAILGYVCGVCGILISHKLKLWNWIERKKFYPIFILLFLVFVGIVLFRILDTNLVVFYFALINLVISVFILARIYFQKST